MPSNETVQQIKNKLSVIPISKNFANECGERNCAAVMLLMIVIDKKAFLLFTKRSNSLNNHRGQIAFPGGKIENQDKSPLDTAIRETREEIGITERMYEILGAMPAKITTKNYFIYPYVGLLHTEPILAINRAEVEKALFIPIEWLLSKKNSRIEKYFTNTGEAFNVRSYLPYEDERIWGITANLTHQLLSYI